MFTKVEITQYFEDLQKDFLKSISHLHNSFGNETTNVLITPVVSSKELFPDQNGQSLYLFSDWNTTKTRPYLAAHTHLVYNL